MPNKSIEGFRKEHDIQTGYELSPVKGWFSVVIPQNDKNSINYCQNPSFETNLNGWTEVNSTISRVISDQYRGAYSCKITPSSSSDSGVYYTVPTGVDGSSYYSASIFIKGNPGDTFYIYCYLPSSSERVSVLKEYRGKANWYRISASFGSVVAGSIRIYIIRKSGGSLLPFYIDCCQFEDRQYPTTYFDGDNEESIAGLDTYYWSLTHHASTSVRLSGVASGGKEVNLNDFGLHVIGYAGLGAPPFNHISTPLSTGGSYYQKSIPQNRQFVLVCRVDGENIRDLHRIRSELISAFSPNTRTVIPQPMILKYYREDSCLEGMTPIINIPCVYSSGLEGNIDNLFSENLAIVFTQYTQKVYSDKDEVDTITSELLQSIDMLDLSPIKLGVFDPNLQRMIPYNDRLPKNGIPEIGIAYPEEQLVGEFGNRLYIDTFGNIFGYGNTTALIYEGLMKFIPGIGWTEYSPSPGSVVTAFCVDDNGNHYAAVSGDVNIYKRAPGESSWSSIGTLSGAGYRVYKMGWHDGYMYVGGYFISISGVTSGGIIRYNGSSWEDLDSGFITGGEKIFDFDFDPSGNIYVVGRNFGQVGSSSVSVNGIAMFSILSGTWSNIGDLTYSGGAARVYSISINPTGTVYVVGLIDTAEGTAVVNVAKLLGGTWYAMSTGLGGASDIPYDIIYVDSTHIYACGTFNNTGVTTLNYIAMWNGSAWVNIDGGLYAPSGSIGGREMAYVDDVLYVIGGFTMAGVVDVKNFARWDSTSHWVNPAYNLAVKIYAGGTNVFHVFEDGTYYIVYNNVGFFDGNNFNYLGRGVNGTVHDITWNPIDASLYVVGEFDYAGGIRCDGVARWDGEWHSLNGIGPYDSVSSYYARMVKVDISGNVYIIGNFPSIGTDTSLSGIAKWNGSSWSDIGGGVNKTAGAAFVVYDVILLANGNMYICGSFNQTVGGTALAGVALWNGSTWSNLGAGVTSGTASLLAINDDETILYVAGNITTIGGISTKIAKWTIATSAWSNVGDYSFYDPPSSMVYSNGKIYVYGGNKASLTGGKDHFAVTSVYDEDTATWDYATDGSTPYNVVYEIFSHKAFTFSSGIYIKPQTIRRYIEFSGYINIDNGINRPVIRFSSVGILYMVRNLTNGSVVYFNKTLRSGMSVTLDFENRIFKDSGGNVFNPLSYGMGDFYLSEGMNEISIILHTNDYTESDEIPAFYDVSGLDYISATNCPDGRLYAIVEVIGIGPYDEKITVYSDLAHTTVVAETTEYDITLSGNNLINSGGVGSLSGRVGTTEISSSDSDADIQIVLNLGGDTAYVYHKKTYQSLDEALYE